MSAEVVREELLPVRIADHASDDARVESNMTPVVSAGLGVLEMAGVDPVVYHRVEVLQSFLDYRGLGIDIRRGSCTDPGSQCRAEVFVADGDETKTYLGEVVGSKQVTSSQNVLVHCEHSGVA